MNSTQLRHINQVRLNKAMGVTRTQAVENARKDNTIISRPIRDSNNQIVRGKYSKPKFVGGLIG